MKKLVLILTLGAMCMAAPAFQGEIDFKQKDGSSFKGELKGDEYFSWVEDTQGNIIKFNNESKNYEYAKLEEVNGTIDLAPSGVKVYNAVVGNASTFINVENTTISKDTLMKIWKQKKENTPFHH